MNKRYQVFVSSTYADLKEERQHVLQALMEMDCIPAGMELFPAADEEQWEFIKKIIDDCDYYLLIIGGRYGSTTDDGISYTEKEFDYAIERGLKVIALIHGELNDISFGKSEQDPNLRDKLLKFKDKVMDRRVIKYWGNVKELPGLVALSLTKTMKTHPATGWVRANNIASENILSEINELRKQNSELKNSLNSLERKTENTPLIDNIADIDSKFIIHGTYETGDFSYPSEHQFEYGMTWRSIFALLAPYIRICPSDEVVESKLAILLKEMATTRSYGRSVSINDQDFRTITIQFEAYGLIEIGHRDVGYADQIELFWSLTSKGKQLMIESRVIRGD